METAEGLLEPAPFTRTYNFNSDAEAIQACQAGNKEAFGMLVEKYKERAYYSALGFVHAHEAARDLSQDAFVRAFKAIKRFDVNKKFFTWYYQILRNLCFNFLRDTKKHARSFSETDPEEIIQYVDHSANTSESLEQQEIKKVVWDGLKQLKPNEREIIILKDFQDLSYKEISVMLEVPLGTVMSRLFNSRKALKSKLERYYHER